MIPSNNRIFKRSQRGLSKWILKDFCKFEILSSEGSKKSVQFKVEDQIGKVKSVIDSSTIIMQGREIVVQSAQIENLSSTAWAF